MPRSYLAQFDCKTFIGTHIGLTGSMVFHLSQDLYGVVGTSDEFDLIGSVDPTFHVTGDGAFFYTFTDFTPTGLPGLGSAHGFKVLINSVDDVGLSTELYFPEGYPFLYLTSNQFDIRGRVICYDLVLFLEPAPKEKTRFFRRGEVNGDGILDVSDPIALLFHVFLGERTAYYCREAMDADDNGRVEISDATFILQYLFLGGPEPGVPGRPCGVDPTPDDLGCESEPPCMNYGRF
jgi:hypothetical protein